MSDLLDLQKIYNLKDEILKKVSKRYDLLTPKHTDRVLDAPTSTSDVNEFRITALSVELAFMVKNQVVIKNWNRGSKYNSTVLNNMEALELVQAPIRRIVKNGYLKIGSYSINLDLFCLDRKRAVDPNKFPRYYMKDNIEFNVSPETLGVFGDLYD
jgi:hypothetical protein